MSGSAAILGLLKKFCPIFKTKMISFRYMKERGSRFEGAGSLDGQCSSYRSGSDYDYQRFSDSLQRILSRCESVPDAFFLSHWIVMQVIPAGARSKKMAGIA